jgi:hypothetical protein
MLAMTRRLLKFNRNRLICGSEDHGPVRGDGNGVLPMGG